MWDPGGILWDPGGIPWDASRRDPVGYPPFGGSRGIPSSGSRWDPNWIPSKPNFGIFWDHVAGIPKFGIPWNSLGFSWDVCWDSPPPCENRWDPVGIRWAPKYLRSVGICRVGIPLGCWDPIWDPLGSRDPCTRPPDPSRMECQRPCARQPALPRSERARHRPQGHARGQEIIRFAHPVAPVRTLRATKFRPLYDTHQPRTHARSQEIACLCVRYLVRVQPYKAKKKAKKAGGSLLQSNAAANTLRTTLLIKRQKICYCH